MRFTLIDRIVDLTPGEKITAVKNLSLAEEYLADHFPGFPVMPGVLMLEAMTQTGVHGLFGRAKISRTARSCCKRRNVKFANFLQPGQTLTITAEILDQDERQTRLKALGHVDGGLTVSARLVLERYNLGDERADRQMADDVVRQKMRELYSLLYQPQVTAS